MEKQSDYCNEMQQDIQHFYDPQFGRFLHFIPLGGTKHLNHTFKRANS